MIRDKLEKAQEELVILELQTEIEELTAVIPIIKDLNKKYGKNKSLSRYIFKNLKFIEDKLDLAKKSLKEIKKQESEKK